MVGQVQIDDDKTVPTSVANIHADQFWSSHPLARRFLQWANHTNRNVLEQAWQVLGMRYTIGAKLYRGDYHFDQYDADADRYSDLCYEYGSWVTADDTQVYLLKRDILKTVLDGDMPEHTISRAVMPYECLFIVNDIPLTLAMEDGHHVYSSWLLLISLEDGIAVTSDITRYDGNQTTYSVQKFFMEYGSVYPNSYGGLYAKEAGFILKLLAFINSPYVDKEKTVAERRERREVKNHPTYKESTEHTVNFILLRREVKEALEAHQRETTGIRNAHKRWWWVSGHNRKQWYPSEGAHHVIWIAPYRKGDTEAAEMVEKIYKVSR